MGGPGTVSGTLDGHGRLVRKKHGDWRQPHDATVAGGMRIRGPAIRGVSGYKALQGGPSGAAYVETPACATEVALPVPAHIPLQLIDRVEALFFHEAFGQAKGHGGVIGPLAGLEVERAAADNIGNWRETAGLFEFKGGAQGIANSEAKQGTTITICIYHFYQLANLTTSYIHPLLLELR